MAGIGRVGVWARPAAGEASIKRRTRKVRRVMVRESGEIRMAAWPHPPLNLPIAYGISGRKSRGTIIFITF